MDNELYHLIEQNDLAGVTELLQGDPSLVQTLGDSEQPIHVAPGNNRFEILKVLIQFGADVNCPDDDGRTPLHRAAELSSEALQILLECGANPNVRDRWGHTPFTWAILGQQPEGQRNIQALRQAGADYDLAAAIGMGDIATVKSIIDNSPELVKQHPFPETLLSLTLTVELYGNRADRIAILKTLLTLGLPLDRTALQLHAQACETSGFLEASDLLRD